MHCSKLNRAGGGRLFGSMSVLASLLLLAGAAHAQSAPQAASAEDTRDLLLQVRDELRQTRAELGSAQQQIRQLTAEVEGLRRDMAGRTAPGTTTESGVYPSSLDRKAGAPTAATSVAAPSPAELRENQELLQAEVQEQHQTKVESASKYRVKLSGLVLMNVFSNRGAVDKLDVPNRALNSADPGSVGATLRQSVVGLQVFGPDLAGAHSSANVSVDFFGGFPQQPFGNTAGIMRLRQASAHLDWSATSLTVGQEAPFVSPLSPTSYATIAEPAMAWSGNLWVWTPQVFAEHRFARSDQSYFSLSGGLLAPLTDEIPNYAQAGVPGPGERGRRPAVGSSFGWRTQAFGDTMQFGVGLYAAHQQYRFGRDVRSWAVTSYWQVPLGARAQLSGEAYRGLAVGGLGGGIAQNVVYNGNPDLAGTLLRPLNAAGGWAQLKVRLDPRWETNFAWGQDSVFSRDLRWAPRLQGEYLSPLARNHTAFGNLIFHPRSNLVLSAEYRKIWTYGYVGPANTADQINLGAGVSF